MRLTAAAERDYQHILAWTLQTFGQNQLAIYRQTLSDALAQLHHGPDVPGSKRRDEIAGGICTLHVGRQGRKGRHFVMFTANPQAKTVNVLRILHDQMDLARHLDEDLE